MSEPPLADSTPFLARRANRVRQFAGLLARRNITPHQLSILSVVFAAAGAGLMLQSPWWLLGAALCIQLRLLCHQLADLLAGEFERPPAAPLYRELPDRIADLLLLVAAGYAAGLPALGWFGALATTLAAFVPVVGSRCRLQQSTQGPMTRQHRMIVLTMSCLLHAMSRALPWMAFGLGIIAAGSVLTCVVRVRALLEE
jgi:phosphatidylglycerophosphate synthase